MPTAIIADDEPLMLKRLRKTLNAAWPELAIVAEARNGIEANALCAQHQPDIAFLDIQMPGKTGLEVAAELGNSLHVVFVTAYDEFAVKAFESGAIDYILKPVEVARLEQTILRIKQRLQQQAATPPDISNILAGLLNRAPHPNANKKLKWLRASLGNATKLINIDDVLFFQSDTKYTRIVLQKGEALVRTPLKELVDGLDEEAFWQVHRGTIVNAAAVDRAVREGPEVLIIHLKNHTETLRVSRQYFHLFKQ
jgi:DNA-binding LytR/AlgR family response regulator